MVNTTKNYYQEHEDLRGFTNLNLQQHFHGFRMFTRHVGDYYIRRVTGNIIDYHRMKINQAGMCDDWGVLPCFCIGSPIALNRAITQCNQIVLPIHIEWETKAGKSGLSPKQKEWRDKCQRMQWLWFLNRGHEQLILEIETELNKRGLVPWIPNIKKK